MTATWRHAILALAAAATIVVAAFPPAIAQPLDYHQFADTHAWLGVPNTWDVLSNLPFALVGLAGLAAVLGRGAVGFSDPWDRWPYAVLFVGVTLTSMGSSYYHLAPDNARLVWDRLPMTVGFEALLAALIAERVHRGLARAAFVPMLAAGVLSVAYWYWSELQGTGDLRPYLVVQFGSLLLVAVILVLYPAPGSATGYLVAGLAAYGAAKGLEFLDRDIFNALGQSVSGHTLKHLAAAGGVACLVEMLRARQTMAECDTGPGGVVADSAVLSHQNQRF
jgi:hypothetical protein